MAVVKGVKERIHCGKYDCLSVEPGKQLRDVESSGTFKFFVNVQGKTKLETNLQTASLLPAGTTYEARAMRVVISDLPPEFSDEVNGKGEEFDVTDDEGNRIDSNGKNEGVPNDGFDFSLAVVADFELDLKRLMELLKEARDSEDKETELDVDDESVTLTASGSELTQAQMDLVRQAGGTIFLSVSDLEEIIQDIGKQSPPLEQIRPNDGAGSFIGRFIYNTVTTLIVGEKEMIKMPTWFFPAGAGLYSSAAKFSAHGEPDPMATFRFAEAVAVDEGQNFRVEVEVPDSDTLREIQKIYGPLKIWVMLDGYEVRNVQ